MALFQELKKPQFTRWHSVTVLTQRMPIFPKPSPNIGQFFGQGHNLQKIYRASKYSMKLPWAVNRRIKNAVIGAATSAIERGDNAFKDYYERIVSNGITPANAKHSVARKMVSTMSVMWKTDSEYEEKLL